MNSESAPSSYKNLAWRDAVARYQSSELRISIWQLINSFGPYLILWFLMWQSLSISYWLTLALAIPAGGFLVRIFIIFHDCGHGSFFKKQRANHFWGVIAGLLTFTPYEHWRHSHAIHHASAGDLDRRGFGDVWTLTVKEYQALPAIKRLWYGMFRHPLIMFGLGPAYMFFVAHRFAGQKANQRGRRSVIGTNLALLAIVIAMHFLIGIQAYLLIQVPVMMIAGAAGVWLFYVQHTFEPPYWEHHAEWDFTTAAMVGSSYYKLPKVLQWFTGNIGIHHIHHLSPRIPNYKLQQCQDENQLFDSIQPLTIRESLRSLHLRVWDEERQQMLSFRQMRKLYGAPVAHRA